MALVAAIGEDALQRRAGVGLDRGDDSRIRVAVVRGFRHRLHMGDELAALAAVQRGGDADLAADLWATPALQIEFGKRLNWFAPIYPASIRSDCSEPIWISASISTRRWNMSQRWPRLQSATEARSPPLIRWSEFALACLWKAAIPRLETFRHRKDQGGYRSCGGRASMDSVSSARFSPRRSTSGTCSFWRSTLTTRSEPNQPPALDCGNNPCQTYSGNWIRRIFGVRGWVRAWVRSEFCFPVTG